ncbi:MAG: HDOD domain-containing protein [Candidatus Muirbacterium halophilum]|nr:HDOD domain-containing protein [Candidatus Muirbacterium halophilum]MCK9475666.1 HDOD domain-containing protein [Candidatus Muirbacterium halophilum]
MSYNDILKQLQIIDELPTLPTIVAKVLEMANSENTTANDLNKIISQDQALTSKTLKLVNSAYYGFPRTVKKIREAVVILGFNAVKNLALSVSICELFNKADADFDRRTLWKHSVGVAVATGVVAKHAKMANEAEDFFVSGLIHDIGLIILDQYFHDDFIKCIKEASSRNIPIEIAEKEIFGTDHAMIGKKMAEIWKLPSKLGNVIGFHHQPQYAYGESKKETSIIYIADLVCKLKHFGFDGDSVIPKLRKEPFIILNIEKDQIKHISKELDLELKKVDDFLKLVEE